jgi:intergrase/recombinase
MQDSSKAIYNSPEAERLRRELQQEINRTTYIPREESERRQALYKKDDAEKANLKRMKASLKSI